MWQLVGLAALTLAGCYSSFQRTSNQAADSSIDTQADVSDDTLDDQRDSVSDSIEEEADIFDGAECTVTCDPSACSTVIKVPEDYSIELAVSRAQLGDIIQIDPGVYEIGESLYLSECTHLKGAGIGRTKISLEDTETPILYSADGCSIDGISFVGGEYISQIMAIDSNITVANCDVSVQAEGDSSIIFQGNQDSWATFYDNSSGSISSNTFSSFFFMDQSYGELEGNEIRQTFFMYDATGRLRNNVFDSIHTSWDSGVPIPLDTVLFTQRASADLGGEADPGNNYFHNYSGCFIDESCERLASSTITNLTTNNIKALGNYYEGSHQIDTDCAHSPIDYCAPFPALGTCEEMSAGANVESIFDGNDADCITDAGEACGVVDYGNFNCI